MFRRKIYGQSRIENCPFCGKRALTKSKQGVPVCLEHKHEELKNLKCACGEWLDVCEGKFGAYFRCMNCGNVSFSKGLEMNPDLGKNENYKVVTKPKLAVHNIEINKKEEYIFKKHNTTEKKAKKEITITSDELDYYFR